jgi:CheY-like chemotaxis protein
MTTSTNLYPRVLVVDDNASIRLVMQHALRRQFDVITVGDVEAAVEAAQRIDFDAFVLDVNLGGTVNGIELCSMLRDLPGHDATPAIACTAYVAPDQRRILREEGFDGYLPKPFTPTELREAVSFAIGMEVGGGLI